MPDQLLFPIGSAAQEEQIIIADLFFLVQRAGVDNALDAALFRPAPQHFDIPLVTVQIHQIVIHP